MADISQPRADGDYTYRREFYQSSDVAAAYDQRRWGSPKRVRRNRHKWATILKALARTEDVHSVLDMPCGTGRFTGHLARAGYDVVGSDISLDMMKVAKTNLAEDERIHGYVQADAEKMPLIDNAIDCIVCIRFFLHVDAPGRVRILHEMGRISRRWRRPGQEKDDEHHAPHQRGPSYSGLGFMGSAPTAARHAASFAASSLTRPGSDDARSWVSLMSTARSKSSSFPVS